jgi:hypothetical protein
MTCARYGYRAAHRESEKCTPRCASSDNGLEAGVGIFDAAFYLAPRSNAIPNLSEADVRKLAGEACHEPLERRAELARPRLSRSAAHANDSEIVRRTADARKRPGAQRDLCGQKFFLGGFAPQLPMRFHLMKLGLHLVPKLDHCRSTSEPPQLGHAGGGDVDADRYSSNSFSQVPQRYA